MAEKKTTKKDDVAEAVDETAVEETAAETPVVDEAPATVDEAVEEPVAEEPAPEETAVAEEEPEAVAEAPAEEPVAAAPVAEEPAAEADEPAAEVDEPAVEEPAVEEPAGAGIKRTRSRRHVPRSLRRTRSKPARETPATRKPLTRTPPSDEERGRRQERRGVVVSDKGDKTIVVKVDLIKAHPKYKKVVRRTVKFHAHDEANTAGVGDTVRIVETRPLSKQKRWRLAEIVEKAK